MSDVTIISYPGSHDDYLLSLTSLRSRYMVPFAGRHRVVDFTLRNMYELEAKYALIFSSISDDLQLYVQQHPLVLNNTKVKLSSILSENIDIELFYDTLKETDTPYYILYCGDNPGFINFSSLLEKYKKKKVGTLLFKLKIGDVGTLAYTILITTRSALLNVIKEARMERRKAPNVFEMINNMLINKGVTSSTFKARYWPLKSIPDYYDYNMSIFKEPELFYLIYNDSMLDTAISRENLTQLGPQAKVTRTYLSDGCIINGTVDNSIVFPGVVVGENAIVKDSILLPYVAVGSNTRIHKSIIDEYTDYSQSDVLFNIGNNVRIGSDEEMLKNNDYPKALYNSISLVGKNALIPDNVKIGAACYVASATSSTVFEKNKTLHDGLSIASSAQGIL
jgi:ADP-glucose pyrophosphorylase